MDVNTRDGALEGKWFKRGDGAQAHRYLTKFQGLVNAGAISQQDALYIFIGHQEDCDWYNMRGAFCNCDADIRDTRTGKLIA